MNHEVFIADDATLTALESLVQLDFTSSPPEPIVTALSLLKEGLVDSINLTPHSRLWAVRVVVKNVDHVALRYYAKRRLEIGLGQREVARLLCFLLKYVRDGHPEVDHLDMNVVWDSKAIATMSLKFNATSQCLRA
jgi:hypothetical protein